MGAAKKPWGLLRRGSALLTPPPGLRRADMIAVGCILATCYFLFQLGDMDLASSISYGYLEGHFIDFYSYNMSGIASVFRMDIDYLQPIYLLFALWNLPLKLFGLTGHVAQGEYKLSAPEVAWTKLLLVLFLGLCSFVIYKIARLITQDDGQARLCGFLFAANPISVYVTFIFGGCEIFGLTLIMLGLYAFLRHDHWRFVLWFALAVPFKFYALIPFVPLLLLDEKNFWKILRALLVAAVPTLACMGLTALDPGVTPLARLSQIEGYYLNLGPTMYPAILLLAYLAICVLAYLKRTNGDEREHQKYAVLLPLAAMASLFFSVFWQMQWPILLMPWFALAFLFTPNRVYSLLAGTGTSVTLFLRIFFIYSFIPPPADGSFLVDPGKFDLENRTAFLGNFWVSSPESYGPVRAFFQPGIMSVGKLMPLSIFAWLDILLLACLLSPFLLELMYRKKDTWPAPRLFKTETGYLRLYFYGGLAAYLLPIIAVSAVYAWLPDLFLRMQEGAAQMNAAFVNSPGGAHHRQLQYNVEGVKR